MNKPIIIDGVDVSECIFYSGHLQEYIGTHKCECGRNCYRNKNCYFKQLQRLKAENEDLKFYIDSYRQTWELDKYKKALEEVREIAKLYQYFNPEILEIKGNLGQIQDLKMTEIYDKINEVLKDEKVE